MEINKSSQQGQALLFVIIALTIALTVGVAITARTLSSIKRTSSTDTSGRVLAAAEGGIEWFLRQPVSILEKLSDGDTGNGTECPQGTVGSTDASNTCVITYQPEGDDKIQSMAKVDVGTFNTNGTLEGEDLYWFVLNPGDVKEVALKDYKNEANYYLGGLKVCWKSQSEQNASGLYYLTYSTDGVTAKKIISPTTTYGTYVVSGEVSAQVGMGEFNSCYTIDITEPQSGIRFKSLYAPSKVGVIPLNGGFPTQGFKIHSLGILDNTGQGISITKEITVYRSLPYAPSAFDYSLYSTAPIN